MWPEDVDQNCAHLLMTPTLSTHTLSYCIIHPNAAILKYTKSSIRTTSNQQHTIISRIYRRLRLWVSDIRYCRGACAYYPVKAHPMHGVTVDNTTRWNGTGHLLVIASIITRVPIICHRRTTSPICAYTCGVLSTYTLHYIGVNYHYVCVLCCNSFSPHGKDPFIFANYFRFYVLIPVVIPLCIRHNYDVILLRHYACF